MKRHLGIFSLTMINIIAVDSLRSLPFSAEYGFSVIFYYLIGALFFMLPVGFVAAELAAIYPARGGIYIWIREALGKKAGLFIIYLQWIYNVIWYPTIMAFLMTIFCNIFSEVLSEKKWFLFLLVNAAFWCLTILNLFGMRISAAFSSFAAILGTLIPMAFISALGCIWLFKGNPISINLGMESLLPDVTDFGAYSFFLVILFGLIGLELSATHADEVREPQKSYPKAILISAITIIVSLTISSLSIAIVVPTPQLNIISGVVQAFRLFLTAFHLEWAIPLIELAIVLGGLGTVAAWMIGPSKGLATAVGDLKISQRAVKQNRYGVPSFLLILQAILFSILSLLFLAFKAISTSYWILTAITAQLALIVYLGLFISAIVLKKKHRIHEHQIVKSRVILNSLSVIGFAVSLFGIFLGFVPPANIIRFSYLGYISIIAGGCLIFLLPAWILSRQAKEEREL